MKTTLLFLLLVFTIGCNSDKNPAELSNKDLKAYFVKDIGDYLNEINNGQWDAAVDYIYPKLFDFAPKAQIIGVFEQMQASGMKMTIKMNQINNVSKVLEEGENQFCRIEYEAMIYINLSAELKEKAELLFPNIEEAYGVGKVTFDKGKNRFAINASRVIVAVTPKGTTNWKYLEYEPSLKDMVDQLLPANVIKQFNL